MKISIDSFKKHGFKVAVEPLIINGELVNAYMLCKSIERTDWGDCLVWQPEINLLTASSHGSLEEYSNIKFKRTFSEIVFTEEDLDFLFKKHKII